MATPGNFLPDPYERLTADCEITIVTGTKATGYMLPRLDLRSGIVALQRYLLCLNPTSAEESWWERSEHCPINKWCVRKRKGQEPWYVFSDGITGRSGTVPPSNVKPEDIVVLTAPDETPNALQDFLHKLVEQFDEQEPDDLAWKTRLIAWWPVFTGMYLPDYAHRRVSEFLRRMNIILGNGMMPANVWNRILQDLTSDYTNFQVTADAVADMCLIVALTETLVEKRDIGLEQGMPIPTENPSLVAFLSGIVHNSKKPDVVYSLLKNVCERMQDKGEQLQRETANAQHVGEFYGKLFASCQWFFAAQRGYRYILQEWGANQHQDVHGELIFCEERHVIAISSLRAQFADSVDQRDLLSVREDIAIKRARHGDDVARQRAKEFIETKLQYPPYTMPFLLGDTNLFPLRR
jgi:hypothetical protein